MDLIKKYSGNQKRYEDYLNGKGDFFFVQDAEDEVIEYSLDGGAFKEIYNINMEQIVPSTYGTYIAIHGDKGSLFVSSYQEYISKPWLWPEIDYKIIGVDEYDKWGNNIKETYQKHHPKLFKNINKTSYVYKIVDAFVYRSPMVPISEFDGSPNHSFAPLCCLETWEDSTTSDVEVLHKRTKDYFENEIMLLNHKNKIHKLENEISELNKTIHIMKNDMQDEFTNKINTLNDEINDVSFIQFKHKIEIVTMIGVLFSLFIKIII